jgi:hypothetical protein
MTISDLRKIVEEGKAEKINMVVDYVYEYAHFKTILDLGLSVHHTELDFDKIMIFSWIKEEVERVRKN